MSIQEENMVMLPIGDRVVVEPLEEDRTFGNGEFIIPDIGDKKPQLGRVIAVGEGNIVQGIGVVPLSVFAGAVVLFSKYAGAQVTYARKQYIVLRESDIFAMVLPQDDFFDLVEQNPHAFIDRTLYTLTSFMDDEEYEEDESPEPITLSDDTVAKIEESKIFGKDGKGKIISITPEQSNDESEETDGS